MTFWLSSWWPLTWSSAWFDKSERLTQVVPPTLTTDLDPVAGRRPASGAKLGQLGFVAYATSSTWQAWTKGEGHKAKAFALTNWAILRQLDGVMVGDSTQLGLGIADLAEEFLPLLVGSNGPLAGQLVADNTIATCCCIG